MRIDTFGIATLLAEHWIKNPPDLKDLNPENFKFLCEALLYQTKQVKELEEKVEMSRVVDVWDT